MSAPVIFRGFRCKPLDAVLVPVEIKQAGGWEGRGHYSWWNGSVHRWHRSRGK